MASRDEERHEYEGDVFYEAWRRGLNPDAAVERACDDYYDGLMSGQRKEDPDESVNRYASRLRKRREESEEDDDGR